MTPTIEEKVKFVREKCIEANPEIVELKFGCEIEHPIGSKKGIIISHSLTLRAKQDMFLVLKKGSTFYLVKHAITKIIGRPIRLADILLALQEEDGKEWNIRIGSVGVYKVVAAYNLRDDNFDHQTNEMKEFIWEILK